MPENNIFMLSELLPDAILSGDAPVKYAHNDSRLCGEQSLFVCIKGFNIDGHDYARRAYDNGCRAFASEKNLGLPADAAVAICKNTRKALAQVCAAIEGYPAKRLKLIAVTGTKGKTTVANYIYASLNAAGKKAMFIGTGGARVGNNTVETQNTTPDSPELNSLFKLGVEQGCEYAVMEVSSQAVKQDRVYGLNYELAVFTNLAEDHISLAEHKNFREYKLCKSRVFTAAKSCVVNADDRNAEFMAKCCPGKVIRVSKKANNDYTIGKINAYRTPFVLGTRFELWRGGRMHRVSVPQPGDFSAYNAALAVAACRALGLSYATIIQALAGATIPGRCEMIPLGSGKIAIIDYAHNESSFNAMLGVLSSLAKGSNARLMCLFGSVGGKAESRREGLARVAEKYCDFVFLTSDNPDRESPVKIIDDIERGFSASFTAYAKIPDREDAIYTAVRMMKKNDILVLAGKGSEDYQLVDGTRIPFSEKEILSRAEELETVKK